MKTIYALPFRFVVPLLLLPLAACTGDASELVSSSSEAISESPDGLNIGFNDFMPGNDEFAYADRFFRESDAYLASIGRSPPGTRHCHAYPSWDVGTQAPGSGSVSDGASRRWFETWLGYAEGHCDEALISFKWSEGAKPAMGTAAQNAQGVAEVERAFVAFRSQVWPGWTGKFSFTPWNEPNNAAGTGNGLGVQIPADVAAAYYLAMRKHCDGPDCKVAAGDFASNGTMGTDFLMKCSDDNGQSLCSAASYMDRYKNYIARNAGAAGLGSGFRPEYFAYHGWDDVNDYLRVGSHCDDAQHCTTRALLQSLSEATWAGAKIWDTEVGVGQRLTDGPYPDDVEQACGASFLLRLSANLSNRIERIYYTRIFDGGGYWTLFDANDTTGTSGRTRPAFTVLADRNLAYKPPAGSGTCR